MFDDFEDKSVKCRSVKYKMVSNMRIGYVASPNLLNDLLFKYF